MAGWRAAMFLAVALLLASSCEDLVHIHISGPVEFAGWTVAVDGEIVDVLSIKVGERVAECEITVAPDRPAVLTFSHPGYAPIIKRFQRSWGLATSELELQRTEIRQATSR